MQGTLKLGLEWDPSAQEDSSDRKRHQGGHFLCLARNIRSTIMGMFDYQYY